MNDGIIFVCEILLAISAIVGCIASIFMFYHNIVLTKYTSNTPVTITDYYTNCDNRFSKTYVLTKEEETELKNRYDNYCKTNGIDLPFNDAVILMADDEIYSVLDTKSK
jgi:hypothetical protein